MKRFVVLMLAVLASISAFAQDVETSSVVFDKSQYDFGVVPRHRCEYSCTFTMTNVGSEPVVILGVDTSCSCLKARYSRRPIAAGGSAEIRVLLEAAKVNDGVFNRVIKVRTNKGVSLLIVRGVSVEKGAKK